MRFQLFLVAFLGLIVSSNAQPPDTLWTRLYGNDGRDRANYVLPTEDNGFIVTGEAFKTENNDSDLYLIKVDGNGVEEWRRFYGGDRDDVGESVVQISNDDFVVLGRTESFGNGGKDFWLLKVSSEGEEEWNYTYGGSGSDHAAVIRKTNDNGFVLVGRTNSFGSGGSDVWLLKIDEQGNEIWNQTYGGSDGEYGYDVQQTTDGGYIITGYSSDSHGNWDLLLIKTDISGGEEWMREYGGILRETGGGVLQTPDQGFIVAGINESIDPGNMNWWLLKTDSFGEVVWERTYGGSNFDICACIDATQDGGYILGGWTPSFGAGSVDIWIVKTDSLGNEVWNQTFGGPWSDGSYSVKQTIDGGYIIAGDYSPTSEMYDQDLWLIRLGSESGIIEPQATTPSEFQIESIYPNPFNAQTTITVNLPETSILRLSVHNLLGQEVDVITHGKHLAGTIQFNLDANNLPSGIYFIHAQVDGQYSQGKKFMLLK